MSDTYSLGLLFALAVGLVATGAVAGVLAGLLGVGGGIVIVPVLFWLFDWLGVPDAVAMHVAVATSLATIIPTSISSARSHHKKGAIDAALLKSWAPVIFVGALIGGLLSKVIASSGLTLIFGVIALLVSINMALPKKIVLADELPQGPIARGLVPGFIGVFSALMGIGGGTLSVPTLTAFSFPVHRAVGTAAAFGLVIAVPAVIGFVWSGIGVPLRPPYSLGYVSIPAAVLIFSASVFTAPVGSNIAHRLNPARLKLAFAAFLFLSALKMLWSALG
ncbi:sulfite exporter TauE/SafE family protein [Vannielia litorea]|uniref:sulfite exporter TauE/SafE family protein n=1 Tax=Vannielia litorea TaxID=1217970 RepID=UPI001BCFE37B|nr:sulfite exporter TauE/SafE family protein [Vannielia litorea]